MPEKMSAEARLKLASEVLMQAIEKSKTPFHYVKLESDQAEDADHAPPDAQLFFTIEGDGGNGKIDAVYAPLMAADNIVDLAEDFALGLRWLPDAARREVIRQHALLSMVTLIRQISRKLEEATWELVLESHIQAEQVIEDGVRKGVEAGGSVFSSDYKYRKQFEKYLRVTSNVKRKRLNVPGRGGARKKNRPSSGVDISELITFIDDARPLWNFITDFFEEHDYDADCVLWIRRRTEFKDLSLQGYPIPNELLKEVFKRKSKSSPQLEPIGFAVEHARRSLNIRWAHNTIRQRYFQARSSPEKGGRDFPELAPKG